MKIGVFDSGIGGEAVAKRLKQLLPHAEIISVNDHEHMPYGNRPEYEIIELTKAAIQPLIDMSCDAIIIACNTATTVAIKTLRAIYPTINFVGLEPMIKPAALTTKTGRIAVFATPGTLKSKRYYELKKEWASNLIVIEPDCSTWAELIENGKSDKINVEKVVHAMTIQNVDVIVLGCTHYHWLKHRIQEAAGKDVTVLEPSDAIAARVQSLIKEN